MTYLKETWSPLGPKYNTVLTDKTWQILDDTGNVIFRRAARVRDDGYIFDQLRCDGDGLYLWSFTEQPLAVTITALDDLGRDVRAISVEPLMHTFAARSKGTLLVYGNHVLAEGKNSLLNQVLAYSFSTGKRSVGQLPSDTSLVLRPMSRPEWQQIYLISSGDYREKDNPLTLIEYDKDLKQTFSHAVSRKNQRLEFICTDKDTIYMATTTPEGLWDFTYFEVKGQKLSDAPFPTPKGTWLNALPFGDGKLVIWGEEGLTIFEARMALRKRAPIIQLPPSPSRSFPEAFTLLREPGSVADDGRFALVVQHRSKKPKDVLVYSKEGKLLEQIEMKEGFIEHLKFLSGSNEVLVFAREYTARVKLNPPPTTAPSTQPTTVPREPSQQVK
ncbi:MAG: hypothetical protein K8T91_07740 [Planctomycetes bacterium]|nr:hypothetical protein [Planctomycetota bacterium]